MDDSSPAQATATEIAAAPRGSIALGIVLGLIVLIGGYWLVMQILIPDPQSVVDFLAYFGLPWLVLGVLSVALLWTPWRRTALGAGLAGLVFGAGTVLLVVAAMLLFTFFSDPSRPH